MNLLRAVLVASSSLTLACCTIKHQSSPNQPSSAATDHLTAQAECKPEKSECILSDRIMRIATVNNMSELSAVLSQNGFEFTINDTEDPNLKRLTVKSESFYRETQSLRYVWQKVYDERDCRELSVDSFVQKEHVYASEDSRSIHWSRIDNMRGPEIPKVLQTKFRNCKGVTSSK